MRVLRYIHIPERLPWPEGVPSSADDLLLVQSPDGTTGVDVWWLEEGREKQVKWSKRGDGYCCQSLRWGGSCSCEPSSAVP